MAPDAKTLDGLISSFSKSTSRIKAQLYIEIHGILLKDCPVSYKSSPQWIKRGCREDSGMRETYAELSVLGLSYGILCYWTEGERRIRFGEFAKNVGVLACEV
jgi:hypothetical protein